MSIYSSLFLHFDTTHHSISWMLLVSANVYVRTYRRMQRKVADPDAGHVAHYLQDANVTTANMSDATILMTPIINIRRCRPSGLRNDLPPHGATNLTPRTPPRLLMTALICPQCGWDQL